MGSVDIPPFMREKLKEKVKSSNGDVPPFMQPQEQPLEKKNLGGNVSSYLSNPLDYGVQSTEKNKFGVRDLLKVTPSLVPQISKNPNFIHTDEEFEKNIVESNQRAADFDNRLVGKMIGTGGGDRVVPYNQNAPIDKPEQLQELTEFKQQDIVEYPKNNFAPTGYKQLQGNEWVDVPRPKKISGTNAEVVIRAFKPKMNNEQVKKEVEGMIKTDPSLGTYVALSDSKLLAEKLLTNPAFAKTLSSITKESPDQATTADGRFNQYEKAVVQHYKLDEDPFVKYPNVDYKTFDTNIKELNKLKPELDQLQNLAYDAKQLKAKYELGKNQTVADEYNKVVEKINSINQKVSPLSEYFSNDEVSEVLHLQGLQERGQQELSSALNYFPDYKEKTVKAYNKSLQKEGIVSGVGKSFAGGTLDMLANIVYTAVKLNPLGQNTGLELSTDKLKDNYDLWSKATFTTGEAKNQFWDIANQVAKMTPQVIGIMATRNPRLANIAFVGAPTWGASYKEGLSQGLSKEQAFAKGMVDAGIETLSETLVTDRAMIKGFKPSKELTELGLMEFGSSNFNRLMSGEVINHITKKVTDIPIDFLGQLTEEVVAMKGGQIANAVTNALTGSDFETDASAKEEANLVGSVALLTLGMKTLGGGFNTPSKKSYRDIILRTAANGDYDGARTIIESMKGDEKIDQEYVTKLEQDLTAFASMKFPEKATPEQKVVLLNEVNKLREMTESNDGVEKEFQEANKEKIQAQKEKIASIAASPKLAKEMLDESISTAAEKINEIAKEKGEEFIPIAKKLTENETQETLQDIQAEAKEETQEKTLTDLLSEDVSVERLGRDNYDKSREIGIFTDNVNGDKLDLREGKRRVRLRDGILKALKDCLTRNVA